MDLRTIFVGFVLFLLMVLPAKSAGIPASNLVSRQRRSETKLCSELLPCQWGVYGNDSRKRIKFHIDNSSCTCGAGRKCMVAEENLSMAAFIYRCVADQTTTAPEISETTTLLGQR